MRGAERRLSKAGRVRGGRPARAGVLLLASGLFLLADAIARRDYLRGGIAAAILLLCALAFLHGKDHWDRS